MKVPFVDLRAQYLRYKEELDGAMEAVMTETAFISGKYAKQFEEDFSEYAGVSHTISCGNGTDSLEILLTALGVGPGDEVIVPALSWISTAEVVGTRGATPVFVDINEFYTIDVEQIEDKITEHTRGIIPVHLYGCPADMPRIMEIAEKHNLFVIEDCAQAHGAEIGGQRIATFGVAGSFSFYPGKNLGAYGDAGAMVTDNEDLAFKSRMIANHGQPKKHDHHLEGRNSRMDGLHGAVLSVKLRNIEDWTEERIAHAATYDRLLANAAVKTPTKPEGSRHVYHLYVIQHEDRDGLMEYLEQNDVGVAIHYPTIMPLMPCYAHLGHNPEDFPVAYQATQRILSLPMYGELSNEQIERVATLIQNYGG